MTKGLDRVEQQAGGRPGGLESCSTPVSPRGSDAALVPSSSPEPPIACSLDGAGQADRIGDRGRLPGDAPSAPIDGGLRRRLPALPVGPVAELSAAEQRCCPVPDFTPRPTAGESWLDVRAPADAAGLLAEVFAAGSR